MNKTLKKTLSIILTILMIVTTIPFAFAKNVAASGTCGDKVTYTYNSETGELIIEGTGAMTDYSSSGSPFYDSAIKIVVIKEGVTSIGDEAFKYCNSLASVTIGNSVTSIGDDAFYSCTSLESVTIPDSVTSIGSSAFYRCTSLASVIIPDSVTSIGSYAFGYCTSLASVTIGNSVTSIDNGVFYGCTSLKSVTIPDSVTSIGKSVFRECTSLASITIPDSVTSIDNCAFEYCTSLKSVHYLGTSEEWDEIAIGSYNDKLTEAEKHFCTEAEAADATCTEDGNTAGWYCSECEEYIIGEEISALGHDFEDGTCTVCGGTCETLGHDIVIDEYVAPTCTETGLTAGQHCSRCDDMTVEQKEIAALGHADEDGNYICDNGCGYEFEKPTEPTPDEPADTDCDHLCHSNNAFVQFIWKIVNFIQKIFGIQQYCDCGITH